jgi:plastocyanin
MKKMKVLLLILICAIILSKCGFSAGPVAVDIRSFSFLPVVLNIKMGTTVTWTNNDSAPHQIKSVFFNSTELKTGQSFSVTFNNPGTFDYTCALSPALTGKVIVE